MGAHLVKALCDRDHQVTSLDDLSGGFIANVDRRAQFLQGSLVDHDALDAMFAKQRFECVYHLAAYAAEGLSHFIKRLTTSTTSSGR